MPLANANANSTDWTIKNYYRVSPRRGNPTVSVRHNGHNGRVTEIVSLTLGLNLFGDDPLVFALFTDECTVVYTYRMFTSGCVLIGPLLHQLAPWPQI